MADARDEADVIEDDSPGPEYRALDPLVGRWRSEGRTVGAPAVRIAGFDTYEWMAGGFFLIHRVDVRMDDDRVEVIEMIGPYDPSTRTFPMRSFDDRGGFATMRASVDAGGVWTFAGETERATLTVAGDGATMEARWERTDDGSDWQHWMDLTFTKVS